MGSKKSNRYSIGIGAATGGIAVFLTAVTGRQWMHDVNEALTPEIAATLCGTAFAVTAFMWPIIDARYAVYLECKDEYDRLRGRELDSNDKDALELDDLLPAEKKYHANMLRYANTRRVLVSSLRAAISFAILLAIELSWQSEQTRSDTSSRESVISFWEYIASMQGISFATSLSIGGYGLAELIACFVMIKQKCLPTKK